MQTQPGICPLGRTGTTRVNDIEPRPTSDPLQHMMEKDRVRVARIRAPQDDQVGFLDLPIGTGAASSPKYRRQTGDAGRVSRPVTTVNIVTPHDHAGEFLGHEIRLIARLRAAKQPERLRSPRHAPPGSPALRGRGPRPRWPGVAVRSPGRVGSVSRVYDRGMVVPFDVSGPAPGVPDGCRRCTASHARIRPGSCESAVPPRRPGSTARRRHRRWAPAPSPPFA